MVSVSELQAYVGASDADSALLSTCLETSNALIDNFVGSPDNPIYLEAAPIVNLAILQVAAELFQRRAAPNGITQFATIDGSAGMRVARDPMQSVYPLLRPWVGLGIG